MGEIENPWRRGVTRRKALVGLAGFLAGSPLLRAQQDPYSFSESTRVLGITEMQNVWDFEAVLRENVPRATFTFEIRGAETEFTKQRNREAFEWVDLVPGKAVDPKSVNLATQVYGTKMAYPILIAPTSGHNRVHPDGEVGTQRGSTAARTTFIVASSPSVPLPKIAAAANGALWYQFYPNQDLDISRARLEEAQALGYQAIVITVDSIADEYPRAMHDLNLGGNPRQPARAGGAGGAAATRPAAGPALYRVAAPGRLWYTWEWFDTIRKSIKVPVLVKAVMTREDAQLCVDRGVGIIVSNHGGRGLDYAQSTFEVLPEIVDVVRGRVPVLIDGGFRRGSDILKALALGANAVCLGRVPRWGLGAFGAAGVQRVLEIVEAELVQAAAAAGCTTMASIDRTIVRTHFP